MQAHHFQTGVPMVNSEMMPTAGVGMPFEYFSGLPHAVGGAPAPWNHTIPTNLPWFQTHNPFPQVDDFRLDESADRRQFVSKRKGPMIDGETLPNKQFISEEVMAARMNRLHIGQSHSDASLVPCSTAHVTQTESSTMQMTESSSWDSRPNINRNSPTLQSKQNSMIVLAPEIAKIEEEPILPRSILERLQKPSMEVVLWKPPGGLVDHLIRSTLSTTESETRKEEEYHKRSRQASQVEQQIFKSVHPTTKTSDNSKACDYEEEMSVEL